MKLLIVASRNFWPITGGHEYMLSNYCKKLHDFYGVEIVVVSLDNNKDDKPDYISEVYHLKKKSNLEFLLSGFKILFSKKQSLQTILFYRKKTGKELSELVSRINPDSVLIDLVRMHGYAKYIPENIKMNLYAEDLFSKRYQMMYEQKQFHNALGQMTKNRFFRVLSKIPFLMRIILKKEVVSIKNEEKESVNEFENIIFVAKEEAEDFNKLFNTNKGTDVTMGFDIPKENYLKHNHSSNKLSIIGNFNIAANKDSLIYIIENVLPHIKSEYTLEIYGSVESTLLSKYSDNEKLKFLGYVEDCDKGLCESDLFLSPTVYGTGIKTKVVKALSLGIPTITNDYGVMNLHKDVLDCLILENDPIKIANHVDNLLFNAKEKERMSKSSVEYIKVHHDWKGIIEKLNNLL